MADEKDNPHKGHRQRLRKRFIETELDGFHSHETLELMLFYIIPRANTNEIAHNLIKKFKTVYGVLQAKPEELMEINGISQKSAEFIKTFSDICQYYLNLENISEKLTNPKDYVNKYFSKIQCEMFLVISVGANMTVRGTYTFPPDVFLCEQNVVRSLAMMTFKNQAHEVVIAHNCEKGKLPVPNQKDYKAINIISDSLKHIGISICDYIISDGSRAFSMYREGAFSFEK